MQQGIRFEDGDAYDRGMSPWSRLAGQTFLDWLSPRPGLQWLDVGCGTGAFTGLITERCASAEVQGVDPSEGQLAITEPMSATLSHSETPNSSLASGFEHSSFKRLVRSRAVRGDGLSWARKMQSGS
jgi:trans-aconitate methyltransferase